MICRGFRRFRGPVRVPRIDPESAESPREFEPGRLRGRLRPVGPGLRTGARRCRRWCGSRRAPVVGRCAGVLAGGDEERDVGVAEIVGPHRLADRFPYRRIPEAATKAAQVEPPTFGGGEDEVLVARVGVEMCGEFVGEESGEADGATSCGCLAVSLRIGAQVQALPRTTRTMTRGPDTRDLVREGSS